MILNNILLNHSRNTLCIYVTLSLHSMNKCNNNNNNARWNRQHRLYNIVLYHQPSFFAWINEKRKLRVAHFTKRRWRQGLAVMKVLSGEALFFSSICFGGRERELLFLFFLWPSATVTILTTNKMMLLRESMKLSHMGSTWQHKLFHTGSDIISRKKKTDKKRNKVKCVSLKDACKIFESHATQNS